MARNRRYMIEGYRIPTGWVTLRRSQGGYTLKSGDEELTISNEIDYPPLAQSFGWIPCSECKLTDGTVDCAHRRVAEMIASAVDHLEKRIGGRIKDPGYFIEALKS